MAKHIDITGQRFGRLLAMQQAGKTPKGGWKWLCRCDCGSLHTVSSNHLRDGSTRSCGCTTARRTHGYSQGRHSLYSVWKAMRNRCNCSSDPKFKYWGGRGIKVCERWNDFSNFLADVEDRPDPSLTLDRIDNERGYEPGNVRWATRKEQSNNRRKRRWRRVPTA